MDEVMIIGSGPAGMMASIYAARKQMTMTVIGTQKGGRTIWAATVENYLGFYPISGYDLVEKFEQHIEGMGVKVLEDEVVSLEKTRDFFTAKTRSGKAIAAQTVVVASGRKLMKLGVPGEDQFVGKGVSQCATCDAPLFTDKDVLVVGSGNAGLDAALQLSKIVKTVYVIEAEPRITGDESLQQRIAFSLNIEVRTGTTVLAIKGDSLVNAVTLRNEATGKVYDLPAQGVFVEIGATSSVDFLPKDVELTERNEIVVDCWNRTNVPGLFAAGDVTWIPHKQIIIAAGEGAKALLSAHYYLTRELPMAAAASKQE